MEVNCVEIFGKRLKKLRTEQALSQKQLGDAIGISKSTVGSYESAERTPDIEILAKTAKHFDVSLDYLMGTSENRTTDTNLKAVGEFTGLSDKAVSNFSTAKEKEAWRNAFNIICESNEFWHIVAFLSLYFESCKGLTLGEDKCLKEYEKAEAVFSSQMEKDISELRATKYFYALVELFEKKADKETEAIKGVDKNG